VIFRELYDLAADPDQLRSDPNQPQARPLEALLRDLGRCRDAALRPSCASVEDG
jgi:hypothetical protein